MNPDDNRGRLTVRDVKDELIEVGRMIGQSLQMMQDAGRKYLALVQRCPETPKIAREVMPQVPESFWDRLLDVGRGSVSPLLMPLDVADYRRLERLPSVDLQEEVLKEGVQVYESGLAGNVDHRVVLYQDLTPQQRLQVFSGSIIRTPEEQKRWLDARARAMADSKGEPPPFRKPWEVIKKELVVREGARIPLAEILKDVPRDELLKHLK
jgi:hypothetical protein